MKRNLLLVLAVILACWGCEEEEPEITEKPWEEEMVMGNFSVNGKDVVTTQDGVSLDYLADIVMSNDLPGTPLKLFTINAYVPTGKNIKTSLESLHVELTEMNGENTSVLDSEVVPLGSKVYDGNNYELFQLSGRYSGSTPINVQNFANITFDFRVYYQSNSNKALESRSVTLEVFKNGDSGGGTGGGTGTGGNENIEQGSPGAMFWLQSDLNCGSITVNVDGYGSKVINAYFPEGAPDCEEEGTAFFNLPTGTYNYSASCSTLTWSGTITVTAGSCTKMQLTGGSGGTGGTGGGGSGGGNTGGGGSTTGQATFWTQSDLECGNITVNIGGYGNKLITAFYSSGDPDCGSSGTATYDLPEGTYSYTASCSSQTWSGTITVIAGSCSQMQLTSSGGGGGSGGGNTGGGGTSPGQATFWIQDDLNCGNINVSISGYGTQVISGYFSSGSPECDSNGTATFNLPAGSYNYTASCSGQTWSGSVSVSAGSCTRMQLTGSSGGGSGGSGGGGGGGSSSGQAMFWTNSDLGCGSISVNIGGYGTKTISAFYDGSPACGSSGNATFNLPVGTYNYTASCSDYTWDGSITVSANGCSKMQLY